LENVMTSSHVKFEELELEDETSSSKHKHKHRHKRRKYDFDEEDEQPKLEKSFLGWKFATSNLKTYNILDTQIYLSQMFLISILLEYWKF